MIISNSRYALVGYFITSYPTRANGIIVIQLPFGAKICSDICPRTLSVPRSEKTVSYEEQIMSKDKYPNIFSPQMETVVFIILQIFFTTCAVLKIGGYLTNRPVARNGYGSIAHEAKPNGLLTRGP